MSKQFITLKKKKKKAAWDKSKGEGMNRVEVFQRLTSKKPVLWIWNIKRLFRWQIILALDKNVPVRLPRKGIKY